MFKTALMMRGRELLDQHQVKVRFLVAGILNTIFGLSTYPLFYYFLNTKLHYLVILFLVQTLNLLFSFITNKFYVFRTSGNYKQEIPKFLMFHYSYILINILALPFLVEFLSIGPVVAQTSFALVVIVLSYFWQSKVTFAGFGGGKYD